MVLQDQIITRNRYNQNNIRYNRYNYRSHHNHSHCHGRNNNSNVEEVENIIYAYAKKFKLCYFHMLNQCKYGQECQFTHGIACEKCHKNVFNPLLPIENQIIEHKKFCDACRNSSDVFDENKKDKVSNIIENESSQDLEGIENLSDNQFSVVECGICYEKVSFPGKTFGLLANCNHVFCYNCIKKWRSTILNLSSVKSCPLCRKISFYVIPSSIFPKNEEEKNLIVSEYRKSRMKIRCKYFRYPEHQFCPFGDECFYAHLLPNGERAVLGPPHVQLEYRSSQNTDLHYISQSEEWWNLEVLRQIREIIESSSFDDHDIQTLLSTLSQIILISEGGRAFREPETILRIRHNNNNGNNGNNNGGNTSEVTVSVESSSSYHPSSQISSPTTSNSSYTQSSPILPTTNLNSLNCTCPCHSNSSPNHNGPLLSNLNDTISTINNSQSENKENNEKDENLKQTKK